MSKPSVWVVIPAYNEGKILYDVLKELTEYDPEFNIVVVDDGSSDDTYAQAARLKIHTLKHPVNLGQGAALATGIAYAVKNNAGIVVTFDADGQMTPEDITKLADELIASGVDIVLGSRFLTVKPEGMNPVKGVLLKLATLITRIQTGLKLTDTHNGFRAMTGEAAAKIKINQNQMAHASEILAEIRRNRFKYKETPVKIKYTDYSKGKGQPIWNSINIMFELFMGDRK